MNAQDAFHVTLLAMIEAMASTIKNQSRPGSQRSVQAGVLLKQTEIVNKAIHGQFPPEFVARAEQFYTEVEQSINNLLVEYQQGI